MARRPLPAAAVIALEVLASHGSRVIRRNDFDLRMHQRGYDARRVAGVLKAFARRGWIESNGSLLRLTEEAFAQASAGGTQIAKARVRPGRRRRSLGAYLAS
jgi:hypothetical protein